MNLEVSIWESRSVVRYGGTVAELGTSCVPVGIYSRVHSTEVISHTTNTTMPFVYSNTISVVTVTATIILLYLGYAALCPLRYGRRPLNLLLCIV